MSNYQPPQPPGGYAPPQYAPQPQPGYGPPPPAAPPPPQYVPQPPPQQYAPQPAAPPQYAPQQPQPAAPPPPGGGRFSGIRGAQAYTQGNYFDVNTEGPGEYDCVVKDLIAKSGRNGNSIIVELEVIASSNPRVPVGCKKSVVNNYTKSPDVAWPNVLAILGACLGLDPSNSEHVRIINTDVARDSEAWLEKATGTEKCFNGKRMRVSCSPHTTKKNQVVTRTRFSPLA